MKEGKGRSKRLRSKYRKRQFRVVLELNISVSLYFNVIKWLAVAISSYKWFIRSCFSANWMPKFSVESLIMAWVKSMLCTFLHQTHSHTHITAKWKNEKENKIRFPSYEVFVRMQESQRKKKSIKANKINR